MKRQVIFEERDSATGELLETYTITKQSAGYVVGLVCEGNGKKYSVPIPAIPTMDTYEESLSALEQLTETKFRPEP